MSPKPSASRGPQFLPLQGPSSPPNTERLASSRSRCSATAGYHVPRRPTRFQQAAPSYVEISPRPRRRFPGRLGVSGTDAVDTFFYKVSLHLVYSRSIVLACGLSCLVLVVVHVRPRRLLYCRYASSVDCDVPTIVSGLNARHSLSAPIFPLDLGSKFPSKLALCLLICSSCRGLSPILAV